MSKSDLFKDFKKSSAIDWKNQIIKELKDKPFDSLKSKTSEETAIQPFYHQDTATSKNYNIHNLIQSKNQALPPRYWVNQAKVLVQDEKQANLEALKALNAGAEGIIFKVEKKSIALKALLNEIKPEYCMISFESSEPIYDLISEYFQFIEKNKINAAEISGFYHFDQLEARDKGEIGIDTADTKRLAELIKEATIYPEFRPLCISANLYQNAGATISHELGLTLSKAVEIFDQLTDLGISIDQIIKATTFSFSNGKNYFFEIAKQKAFKYNLLKIIGAYGGKCTAENIFIHVNSSIRTKSALDFNVNLLRNTNEAMSAIIGGCNSLWIQAHDEAAGKEPSPTFNRTALNISTILKEEAHFDKIVDPTQGSYYVESIIGELAEKSWDLFIDFENEGSYSHHFDQSNIHQLIESDAGKEEARLWSRKEVMIGTNSYQLIGERVADYIDTEDSGKSLQAKRLSTTIEHMRSRVEILVAKEGEASRPKAQLIVVGSNAIAKAKADFSYNFLGIAGIAISSEKIVNDLDTDIELDSEADILVLCFQETPDKLEKFISTHDKIQLIAGPELEEDKLKKAGLYGFINRNVNTKKYLDQLLEDLGIGLL